MARWAELWFGFMKSYDFIEESKIEELKKFCDLHNPTILLQIEHSSKSNDGIRIIAETDVHNIQDYEDYLYLLKHGVERRKYEKPKENMKKWYQFWR